jgi:hypothetical protein
VLGGSVSASAATVHPKKHHHKVLHHRHHVRHFHHQA